MMDIRHSPSLTVLLRQRALSRPDQDALIHVQDALGGAAVHLAWKNLDHHARSIGATLQSRLAPGARVLLLLPPSDHAVPFIGCLYSGMVAVPGPLPGRRRHERARLAAIAVDCGAELVLTSAAARSTVTRWLRAERLRLEVHTLGADVPGSPQAWSLPRLNHHTTALLQYGPGTGGAVRGVMVSHGTLLSNAAEMYEVLGIDPEARFGGWVPLHEGAGLTAQTLAPLLHGSTAALMAPATFLRRPAQWLHMIDRYDLAWSAAPRFGYDLCRRRVTDEDLAGLDLSRWRHALTDIELAPGVEAFAARFAAVGLRPGALSAGYGRTEATAFVSGGGPGEAEPTTAAGQAPARREARPCRDGSPAYG